MPTLADFLNKQIAELESERARIEAQHAENLAGVDEKLGLLKTTAGAVTKELEGAYAALLRLGLIQKVER